MKPQKMMLCIGLCACSVWSAHLTEVSRALFEQYGGRVIFQQFGREPIDACRTFLQEEEEKGSFKIIDKQYETEFWRYYTNDAMHTFYSEEDAVKYMNTPWWMMDEPLDK